MATTMRRRTTAGNGSAHPITARWKTFSRRVTWSRSSCPCWRTPAPWSCARGSGTSRPARWCVTMTSPSAVRAGRPSAAGAATARQADGPMPEPVSPMPRRCTPSETIPSRWDRPERPTLSPPTRPMPPAPSGAPTSPKRANMPSTSPTEACLPAPPMPAIPSTIWAGRSFCT